jgi:hypothetical protein
MADDANALAREAAASREQAAELERRIAALRTGRPVREAATKEEEAVRMKAEREDLARAAAGEDEDARCKRAEAERVADVAAAKVKEADALAKQYWAARDGE